MNHLKKTLLLCAASLLLANSAYACSGNAPTDITHGPALQVAAGNVDLAWYTAGNHFTLGFEIAGNGVRWNKGMSTDRTGFAYGLFARRNFFVREGLYWGLGTGVFNVRTDSPAFDHYRVPFYSTFEYNLTPSGNLKIGISLALLTYHRNKPFEDSLTSLSTGSLQLAYLF